MDITDLQQLIDEVEKAIRTLEILFGLNEDLTQEEATKLMNLRRRYPGEIEYDFDKLNLLDLLELLRCKCKSLNDRKGKCGLGSQDGRDGRDGRDGLDGMGLYDKFGNLLYDLNDPHNQYGRLHGLHGSGFDMSGAYGAKRYGDLGHMYGKGEHKEDGDDLLGKGGLGMFDTDETGADGIAGAAGYTYLTIKQFAIIYINKILEESVAKIGVLDENVSFFDHPQKTKPIIVEIPDIIITPDSKPIIEEKIILTIGQFSVDLGKTVIEKSITAWELKKNWLYCINFIVKMCDACSDSYLYEVIWSIPTADYPIPQVTVTTHFRIDVSRVKLPFYNVPISYVFEGEQHRFAINDEIQHEKFLDNIMKCKTELFKTLHFTPKQKMLYKKYYNS